MLEIFVQVFDCCLVEPVVWFGELLNVTGFENIYFGYVFVAMATGFLLKRFGSALSLGSDKAAQHFKRKGGK